MKARRLTIYAPSSRTRPETSPSGPCGTGACHRARGVGDASRGWTIIEVFEWRSSEAIQAAHANPAVQALWAEFNEACDYRLLASLSRCLLSSTLSTCSQKHPAVPCGDCTSQGGYSGSIRPRASSVANSSSAISFSVRARIRVSRASFGTARI